MRCSRLCPWVLRLCGASANTSSVALHRILFVDCSHQVCAESEKCGGSRASWMLAHLSTSLVFNFLLTLGHSVASTYQSSGFFSQGCGMVQRCPKECERCLSMFSICTSQSVLLYSQWGFTWSHHLIRYIYSDYLGATSPTLCFITAICPLNVSAYFGMFQRVPCRLGGFIFAVLRGVVLTI